MRSGFQYGVLKRSLANAALAAAASGCAFSQTGQTLDRSYEAATARIREAGAGSTEGSAISKTDLAGPLRRDAVVAHAVARSPALAVMAHRARALVHAGNAERSLPSAEVGVEMWNLPLDRPYAFGEADMYMVNLRQRFPAAASLDARARAMAEEARAMLAELSSQEQLVAERAAIAFAEYMQAFAEKRLQEQQLALLERMAQAVRARYTTGGSGLADAARIDVEVAKAQRALARFVGDLGRSRATLNAVLRRSPGAPLGEPREASPETVRLTVDELTTRAADTRGATLSAEARVRAAAARREAAEAEARIPDFTVGLGYWQAPRMRPGLGASVSMSLPWLWGPARDRLHQAQEQEAAERAERDNVGLDAQADVTEAHARLVAVEAQLSVIRERALPSARRSLEALTAAFSTGRASFLEWVEVTRSVLDLEMEVVVLNGELARSVAGLERAVGVALPRSLLYEDAAP